MNLLYLTSDVLGTGNNQLGKKLLINFLQNLLSEFVEIDVVFCVNSAVSLTCENDKAIEILKEFNNRGSVISSCGTCLDFYKLKDKLQVGEIGSMSLLIQLMNNSEKIIRP